MGQFFHPNFFALHYNQVSPKRGKILIFCHRFWAEKVFYLQCLKFPKNDTTLFRNTVAVISSTVVTNHIYLPGWSGTD